MSFVALGLFILACGWNFYREYLPTRTNAIRAEGHPQYFGATLSAGFIFLLACCLHTASSHSEGYREALATISALSPRADDSKLKGEERSAQATYPNVEVPVVTGEGPLTEHIGPAKSATATRAESPTRPDDFTEMTGIAIWCGLLCLALPQLLNLPFALNRLITLRSMYAVLEDVERFAVDATQRELAVAYTLHNGKIYVGVPKPGGPDSNSNVQWIYITPLASGRRDSDGMITLTTAYTSVYEEMESDGSEPRGQDDFRIGIPVNQIITMQYFDLDLYTRRFEALATSDPVLSGFLAEALQDEQDEEREAIAKTGQMAGASPPPDPLFVTAEPASKSGAPAPAPGLDRIDVALIVAQWSATVSIIFALLFTPLSWNLTLIYAVIAGAALIALSLLPSGQLSEWMYRRRARY